MYTYTTVTQEALKASYTSLYKTLQILVVAWDDATVKADINPALAL